MTLQDECGVITEVPGADEREAALLASFVDAPVTAGLLVSHGIPFAFAAGVALSGLLGGTGTVLTVPAGAAQIRHAGGWTTAQAVIGGDAVVRVARPQAPARPAGPDSDVDVTAAPATPVTGVAVTELYELSGLTWKQVSRLFGVSERAVHLWASGATAPSRRHLGRLQVLLDAVHAVDASDSSSRRALLLAHRGDRPSVFNAWLAELSAGRPAVGDADGLHAAARHD